MTTATMFSGADISGRDELFVTAGGRAMLDDGVAKSATGIVARIATIFSIVAVAITCTPDTPVYAAADITTGVLTMKDEIAQGVRSASSDGTQPNEAARSNALTVVQAFRAAAIEPQRVVGDPDGGIAVYIFGGTSTGNGGQSKFARVLATNEGEIIAMCVDSKTSRPGVWEADTSNLDKSISRIQSFING